MSTSGFSFETKQVDAMHNLCRDYDAAGITGRHAGVLGLIEVDLFDNDDTHLCRADITPAGVVHTRPVRSRSNEGPREAAA